jgi:putative hydrolase of the HAD superfamily
MIIVRHQGAWRFLAPIILWEWPAMISAVTFDVWETLITDPPDLSRARSASRIRLMAVGLACAGFPVPESDLWAAYDRCWNECERLWDRNKDISTAEQVAIILDALDPMLPANLGGEALAQFTAAYIDPIFDLPPGKKDGLPEVLEELRKLGCKIGLICNTGRTPGWAVRKVLATHGLLSYFEALAFSDEERIRKPAPEIFRRVLATLDVTPADTAHVGDNPLTDICGAKGLGMRAILIGQARVDGASPAPDARIASLRELVPALRTLRGTSEEEPILPR